MVEARQLLRFTGCCAKQRALQREASFSEHPDRGVDCRRSAVRRLHRSRYAKW